MSGFNKKELLAFLEDPAKVESAQEVLRRRLGNSQFKSKWEDYNVKMAQLEKLKVISGELNTVLEEPENGSSDEDQ